MNFNPVDIIWSIPSSKSLITKISTGGLHVEMVKENQDESLEMMLHVLTGKIFEKFYGGGVRIILIEYQT